MQADLLKKRSLQVFFGILFLSVVVLAYHLRSIFNPLLLSLLLAYIANPAVNKIEKWGIGRVTTISCIYVLLMAALSFSFLVIVPLIGDEVSILYQKTFVGDSFLDENKNNIADEKETVVRDLDSDGKYDPSYVNVILAWMKKDIEEWNTKHPNKQIALGDILDELSKPENLQKIFAQSPKTIVWAQQIWSHFFILLSYLVFVPVYTFFLLRSLNNIRDTIFSYLPKQKKNEVRQILQSIHLAVSSFFRGKLLICVIKAILTWAVLQLFGVKFALLFGLIQGVASVVPFMVLIVGLIPNMVIVALESDSSLLGPLLGLFCLYMFIEGIEGVLLTPMIMGKETGMHPLTVILSLLVGGELFGVFGLILAIPFASALKILLRELVLPGIGYAFGHNILVEKVDS